MKRHFRQGPSLGRSAVTVGRARMGQPGWPSNFGGGFISGRAWTQGGFPPSGMIQGRGWTRQVASASGMIGSGGMI